MKILKSFSMFETRHWPTVPGHFIPLQSIGYYLDPNDGNTYAMLKNGGYEDYPWPADEVFGVDDEPWQQLSDEEKEIVNSLWRSCEEVVKPLIDWNLIDDIKDVSLANESKNKTLRRIFMLNGSLTIKTTNTIINSSNKCLVR